MDQEVKDLLTKMDKLDSYWQKIEWYNLKYDNPELYSKAIESLNKDKCNEDEC